MHSFLPVNLEKNAEIEFAKNAIRGHFLKNSSNINFAIFGRISSLRDTGNTSERCVCARAINDVLLSAFNDTPNYKFLAMWTWKVIKAIAQYHEIGN